MVTVGEQRAVKLRPGGRDTILVTGSDCVKESTQQQPERCSHAKASDLCHVGRGEILIQMVKALSLERTHCCVLESLALVQHVSRVGQSGGTVVHMENNSVVNK